MHFSKYLFGQCIFMKVIKLTERDLRNIVKRVISESEGAEETTESKPRCLTTNTMSLDEINGDSDSFRPYSDSINKRNGGVTGIIDTLDLLKTIRLNKNISDGGEHLSYDLLNLVLSAIVTNNREAALKKRFGGQPPEYLPQPHFGGKIHTRNHVLPRYHSGAARGRPQQGAVLSFWLGGFPVQHSSRG